MSSANVLILHGSPGSGKSTLARTICEQLRADGVAHAVIDVDELNPIFPPPRRDFWLTQRFGRTTPRCPTFV